MVELSPGGATFRPATALLRSDALARGDATATERWHADANALHSRKPWLTIPGDRDAALEERAAREQLLRAALGRGLEPEPEPEPEPQPRGRQELEPLDRRCQAPQIQRHSPRHEPGAQSEPRERSASEDDGEPWPKFMLEPISLIISEQTPPASARAAADEAPVPEPVTAAAAASTTGPAPLSPARAEQPRDTTTFLQDQLGPNSPTVRSLRGSPEPQARFAFSPPATPAGTGTTNPSPDGRLSALAAAQEVRNSWLASRAEARVAWRWGVEDTARPKAVRDEVDEQDSSMSEWSALGDEGPQLIDGSGGKETPLFAMPFIYKMHQFTKTGSGQT